MGSLLFLRQAELPSVSFDQSDRSVVGSLRVLADDVLVFGEINAKRLVVCDVAFEPLNIRPKLAQYPIRFCCCSTKLLALEGADLWNVAFDDELAQCHIAPP